MSHKVEFSFPTLQARLSWFEWWESHGGSDYGQQVTIWQEQGESDVLCSFQNTTNPDGSIVITAEEEGTKER